MNLYGDSEVESDKCIQCPFKETSNLLLAYLDTTNDLEKIVLKEITKLMKPTKMETKKNEPEEIPKSG